jgi:hypothetical protein
MTPEQHRKLGAMGYFDSNKSKIDKEDMENKLWDEYSEQSAKNLDKKTLQLIDNNPNLSQKGVKRLLSVSGIEGHNIEDSIYHNIDHGSSNKREIMNELNEIRKSSKDSAEFFLEKNFGYATPKMPENDAERKAHQLLNLFDEFNEEETEPESIQRRVDYLQAKKILNESIDKTIDTAIREMPKE